MPDVRGIIFDLDGTLVDSRLDFDAMRRDMGLPVGIPILEALESVPDGAARDRMLQIMHDHEVRGADASTLIDGVVEFLSHIEQLGIVSAVLTRNSRPSALRTLQRWNLSFSQVVTREDAPPKPDPAGVRLIADRWQIPSHQIVVVGDYLFDLQAGRKAGSRCVLFAQGECPAFASEADFILRDFRQAAALLEKMVTDDK